MNKIIANAQPGFGGQVKVNQNYYYTSIAMITRREVQKLVWQSCKHNLPSFDKFWTLLILGQICD